MHTWTFSPLPPEGCVPERRITSVRFGDGDMAVMALADGTRIEVPMPGLAALSDKAVEGFLDAQLRRIEGDHDGHDFA